MSHTDAHLPYWVRLLDPTRTVEEHDHSNNDCDLPDFASPWYLLPYSATHCHWEITRTDSCEHPCCGCHMCTNHIGRSIQRRKERYAARRIIKDQYEDYLDELDTH